MMMIIFGLFSNGMFIFNAKAVFEGDPAMTGLRADLGQGMSYMLISELLIMAGDFHYQDYNQSAEGFFAIILWAWFILALVFTQVVFLNTLIAIITDTFERVWEKKNQIVVSSQADLLCDWLSLRGMINVDMNEQFLFVVQPTYQDESANENWEGKLAKIKKVITLRFNELRHEQREFRREIIEKQSSFGQELVSR